MVDSLGVYFVLRQYGSLLQDSLREPLPRIDYRNVRRVIVCGMGGSGVIGDFVSAVVDRVSVHVVKDYDLPSWVSKDDLVICVSYSGNTEETLSCFRQALRLGCLCFVVASGGKLLSAARDGGVAHARVLSGIPPRFATVPMLVPVLAVLNELGVSEAYQRLPHNVLVDESFAEKVAARLLGKTPLIYASQRNALLAMKFKTDINENAKVPAFFNVFPESNHNELNSYEHITSRYAVVFLHDSSDHPRVKARVRAATDLLLERGVDVIDVPLSSRDLLYKLLHGNLLSLFVAYFLAQGYGVDPGPVEIIEKFKHAITQE